MIKWEKPSIPFTPEMFIILNEFRRMNLRDWNTLFKIAKISWMWTIDYRKTTGRISYKMVRKLQKIWIDLTS